jgi:hypothetical protein
VLAPATSLPSTVQARGNQPEESIVISLPTSSHRGPAQARGALPEESFRDLVAQNLRALRCTLPSRTEPRSIELMPRSEAPRAHSQKTSFVDAWARANVLAFSCERTLAEINMR